MGDYRARVGAAVFGGGMSVMLALATVCVLASIALLVRAAFKRDPLAQFDAVSLACLVALVGFVWDWIAFWMFMACWWHQRPFFVVKEKDDRDA